MVHVYFEQFINKLLTIFRFLEKKSTYSASFDLKKKRGE